MSIPARYSPESLHNNRLFRRISRRTPCLHTPRGPADGDRTGGLVLGQAEDQIRRARRREALSRYSLLVQTSVSDLNLDALIAMLKAHHVNVTGNQDAMLALLAQIWEEIQGHREARPCALHLLDIAIVRIAPWEGTVIIG